MPADLPHLDTLIATVEHQHAFSDLDRVSSAVTVAGELGSLGDRLVTHFVAAAREAGCSWSQIGEQLGVSKQAAQQGFAAPPKTGRFGRARPTRMTEQARAAVALALEQARALGHDHIGTEHLLLGLLGQSASRAGHVLHQSGIGTTPVAAKIEELAGHGAQPRRGRPPFSPRAKKVLQLALREALAAKQREIDTEHILLGMLREGEGLGCQILVELGVDLRRLRQAVLDVLP
jgi:hypothetical protein